MAAVTDRTRNGRKFYEAVVNLKGHPPRSKSFDKKTEAERWAAAHEVALREGKRFSVVPSKTRIDDPIEDWWAENVEWGQGRLPAARRARRVRLGNPAVEALLGWHGRPRPRRAHRGGPDLQPD